MKIELKGISKSFHLKHNHIKANNNISFAIEEGEYVGLFGDNGCGKTTLIREILGITLPDKGQIYVDGKIEEKGLMNYSSIVGYMSQTGYAALYYLKVKEAIAIVAKLKDVREKDADKKLEEILEYFEISKDITGKYIFQLSGGQRRILSFFLAIINSPNFLILDEPSNDLDPNKRYKLWSMLEKMNREGTTIILVTHSIAEIEEKISRVILLKKGEVRIDNSAEEVRAQFCHKKRIQVYFNEALTDQEKEVLEKRLNPSCLKPIDETSFILIIDEESNFIEVLQENKKFIGYSEKKVGLEDICFAAI